jgi:hypothetical protein
MTRGRQANQVLVVTNTNDLAEARDIIEHVITNDRADVPAVTRRQQLRQDRVDAVLQRWIDEPPVQPVPRRGGGVELD